MRIFIQILILLFLNERAVPVHQSEIGINHTKPSMSIRLIRVHKALTSQPNVRHMVISYQHKHRITLTLQVGPR